MAYLTDSQKHHSVGIQINKLLQPKNNLGRGDLADLKTLGHGDPNCLGRSVPNSLGRVDPNCLGRGDPNFLGRVDPNFLTQKIWVWRVCTKNFWVVFDYIFWVVQTQKFLQCIAEFIIYL